MIYEIMGTTMTAKLIFTFGDSGTKDYLTQALETAYYDIGRTVFKKGFANDPGTLPGEIPKTKIQRFQESTAPELITQINQFVDTVGEHFDVVLFTGWRTKLFVQAIYSVYGNDATYIFVKENPAYPQDGIVKNPGWNLDIQEEVDMKATIDAQISNFYNSNIPTEQWASMALPPTIDLSPFSIRTENGPHMYAILGQPLL
jgi:virulence-associated protein VapD